jgi:hypothetical protein
MSKPQSNKKVTPKQVNVVEDKHADGSVTPPPKPSIPDDTIRMEYKIVIKTNKHTILNLDSAVDIERATSERTITDTQRKFESLFEILVTSTAAGAVEEFIQAQLGNFQIVQSFNSIDGLKHAEPVEDAVPTTDLKSEPEEDEGVTNDDIEQAYEESEDDISVSG